MLELIRQQQLPAFALAFYKELSAAGDGAPRPERLGWIGSDVVLLAPYRVDEQRWGGFLIAEAEAGGQCRLLRTEDGHEQWFEIPASVSTAGAVMAAEGSTLPIAESRPAPHCGDPQPLPLNGSSPG